LFLLKIKGDLLMSIKFLVGSIVAATVIFTGCASKDVGTASSNNSGASSSKSSEASGSSSTMAPSSSMSALEAAQSKIKTINFDFDKFNIRADMQPVAEENAKVAADKSIDSSKVKLEGNADERGTDEYNYALALKRANAVKSAYETKGVAASRITTVSLGEGNPVCKESTEECWAKNRRVDTKLGN
jgi:peptidoglycan-associated lipoprotein